MAEMDYSAEPLAGAEVQDVPDWTGPTDDAQMVRGALADFVCGVLDSFPRWNIDTIAMAIDTGVWLLENQGKGA